MRPNLHFSLIILLTAFFCSHCSPVYAPGSSLGDVKFKVYPHLVNNNGAYVLNYQIDTADFESQLVRVLHCKIGKDKVYYFFSIPISHPEFGNLKERALNDDGLTEFAKNNAVYWLNEDRSEVRLEIRDR